MAEDWLSYHQLAEHWKMSVEAARTRARRGRFQRRTSNDGQTEVLVDLAAPIRKPRPPRSGGQIRGEPPPSVPSKESPSATLETALKAIQEHVVTLKAEIAKAEARADQFREERDTERERVADLTSQLLRITTNLAEARKVEVASPRGWWRRLIG
jgi:hypothetical protein